MVEGFSHELYDVCDTTWFQQGFFLYFYWTDRLCAAEPAELGTQPVMRFINSHIKYSLFYEFVVFKFLTLNLCFFFSLSLTAARERKKRPEAGLSINLKLWQPFKQTDSQSLRDKVLLSLCCYNSKHSVLFLTPEGTTSWPSPVSLFFFLPLPFPWLTAGSWNLHLWNSFQDVICHQESSMSFL